MAEAKRDGNYVPTIIGALNTDGVTPTVIQAIPTTHAIRYDDNTTGSDFGRAIAVRDGNRVPVLLAVSSGDGLTPIELYVNTNGQLLMQST